jgi:hypothetical protein
MESESEKKVGKNKEKFLAAVSGPPALITKCFKKAE